MIYLSHFRIAIGLVCVCVCMNLAFLFPDSLRQMTWRQPRAEGCLLVWFSFIFDKVKMETVPPSLTGIINVIEYRNHQTNILQWGGPSFSSSMWNTESESNDSWHRDDDLICSIDHRVTMELDWQGHHPIIITLTTCLLFHILWYQWPPYAFDRHKV